MSLKKEDVAKINSWLAQNKERKEEAEAVSDQIKSAAEHNSRHAMVKALSDSQAKLTVEKSNYEDLTVQYEATNAAIEDAIRSIELPVEGLGFDLQNDELLYKGKKVNPDIMATSEIMMLGAEIKLAMHPNVKVLCIQRGESLGTKKWEDLLEVANKKGFQLFVEQMERGKENLEIQLIAPKQLK